MKKLLVSVMLLAFAGPATADEYVRGYVRKDGTYVEPHYRSNNDGRAWNNYSAQGNYNPYTGQKGTVDPYAYSSGSNNLLQRPTRPRY